MFARIQNGIVAELFTPPEGVDVADCFVAEIVAQMVPVPDGVSPQPGWTYAGTTFAAPVNPVAPPPTAADVLAEKIAAGIAITCTGNAALSATYALDEITMTQIGSVARDAASGLGLAMGAPTFGYPDAMGALRVFNETQIIALYKAMRDLLFVLNSQAAMMMHGAAPSWPQQSATIA